MNHRIDNIIHYPYLREINREFLTQVESVFIFGDVSTNANCLLLFTRDARLFAYGDNEYGELGLGHKQKVHEPTEIMELHKIKIDTCKSGKHFIVVKTILGKLFAWGKNAHGQLGCGHFRQQLQPVEVMDVIEGVTQFSCGELHTAALLQDGTLWSWGANDYGQLDGINGKRRNLPFKIRDNIALVDCGKYCTAVLTNQFEVYIWGNLNRNRFNVTKVELPSGLILADIICGPNSLMLLTVDGKPFHFDMYDYVWSCLPVKVKEPVASVTNNYVCNTFPTDNPFCFKLLSGCVTVWSKENVIETTLTSVPDTCALFLKYDYTRTPIALSGPTFEDCAMNFNKKNLPVCRGISVEGKSIYLDMRVISQLSSYFVSNLRFEFGIQIPNHDVPIEPSLLPKINQLIQKDSFADMFIYLHTLHKGNDEIDHEWAFKMMGLIEGKPDPELRDHYLHEVAFHKPPTFNALEYWNLKTYFQNNFTLANSYIFAELIDNAEPSQGVTKEEKNEMLLEIFEDRMPSLTMDQVKKGLAELLKLENNGKSNVPIPVPGDDKMNN